MFKYEPVYQTEIYIVQTQWLRMNRCIKPKSGELNNTHVQITFMSEMRSHLYQKSNK